MIKHSTVLGIVACLFAGCTSFRTTALYRFDNDSVVPECTNQKLKGLPVKLKVPSHVRVVVYEQQIILADSTNDAAGKVTAKNEAAAKLKTVEGQVEAIPKRFTNSEKAVEDAQADVSKYQMQLNATAAETGERSTAQSLLDAANATLLFALQELKDATAENNRLPKLVASLPELKQKADLAAANVAVGYRLVSFSPAQLFVETNLEYTDKVFLVDFRRPAGGVLDLKGASMDDEQYFSKIQAEVTERTLQDVSTAIGTVKGAITPPAVPNTAKPTAANTPDAEAESSVDFQKSVVATQRFDISEPGWEERMMAFVNERLCSGGAPQYYGVNSNSPASNEETLPQESPMVEMSPIPNVSRTAQSSY